jgi:hypothetical protein
MGLKGVLSEILKRPILALVNRTSTWPAETVSVVPFAITYGTRQERNFSAMAALPVVGILFSNDSVRFRPITDTFYANWAWRVSLGHVFADAIAALRARFF